MQTIALKLNDNNDLVLGKIIYVLDLEGNFIFLEVLDDLNYEIKVNKGLKFWGTHKWFFKPPRDMSYIFCELKTFLIPLQQQSLLKIISNKYGIRD